MAFRFRATVGITARVLQRLKALGLKEGFFKVLGVGASCPLMNKGTHPKTRRAKGCYWGTWTWNPVEDEYECRKGSPSLGFVV